MNGTTTHTQPSPFPHSRDRRRIATREWIVDEFCYCGALRSEHADTIAFGHGPCERTGCKKFTWNQYLYGQVKDKDK